MHLVLNLTNLRLLCKLHPTSEGEGESKDASDVKEAFEVDTQELVLAAGGTQLVRLGVCPNWEGELRIEGAGWTLNGSAHGSTKYELQGRRLNKTKAQRMAKMYAFDQSLNMPVIPPQPLMSAVVENMPESMLLGQVTEVTVVSP